VADFGKPIRGAQAVAAYLVPLAASAAALAAARWVPVGRLPLIPCAFLKLTGYPCLFCGTTRGFFAAGRGHWAEAAHQSPLGTALYLLAALVLAWSAAGLIARRRLWPQVAWGRHKAPLIIATVVAVLGNWAYRLAAGLK
jgi:hypothetical protein